jgi:hypothetical protein
MIVGCWVLIASLKIGKRKGKSTAASEAAVRNRNFALFGAGTGSRQPIGLPMTDVHAPNSAFQKSH